MKSLNALKSLLALVLAFVALPAASALQEKPEDMKELDGYERALTRGLLKGESARDLDDYLKDFPDSARGHLVRAQLRGRKGDYEGAEEDLARTKILLAESSDAALRIRFAATAFDLHFERGNVEGCGKDLEFGLTGVDPADPSGAALHSRKVALLVDTGKRKEAFSQFADHFKDTPKINADAGFALEYCRAMVALGDVSRVDDILVRLDQALGATNDPRQAEVLLLLGTTYRRGRSKDGNAALGALNSALELDRTATLARVERARAYIYRMDFDKADEELKLALEVNPRHPDALATRGQILLLDLRTSEGLASAEAALHENPRHGPGLAVQATAHWLLGHKEQAESIIQALEAAHAGDAEDLCRIADILNYLYRFNEAIPIYRRALEASDQWAVSYVGLARCLVNTGALDDALDALAEFRTRDRQPYPLADNTDTALHTLKDFVEIRRGNFTYLMHPIESPVLVPMLEELYARVWPDLCSRYGFDPARSVRVECFPRHDDFSARTVGFTGFGALGVCFGDVFTLLSPRSEMRGQFPFDKTAVHELTHVVTLGLSHNKVPRWLTEGISVHEEHVYAKNGDREMDLDLFNYYHSGEIVPIRELNRLFGGSKILFGYYQGGLLADFLVERYGEKVLTDMLNGFSHDEEAPAVVQAVLGMSSEELDRAFLAWIERTKVGPMKVQPNYTEQGRRRLLERVRSADRPDAALLAQVAWAYHRVGATVDRDDFLNRALKLDSRLPAAHFLLAERAMQGKRPEEAKKELETGFANGGEEFSACMHYADLLAKAAGAEAAAGAGAGGESPVPGEDPHHSHEPRAVGPGGSGPKKSDLSPEQRAALEKVLEVLARAKDCFPRYVAESNPYVRRAKILEALDRHDEALTELRTYCDIHESDTSARSLLIEEALGREDWSEAKRYLLELRAIDPFERKLWSDLARCEKELGRTADAIRDLELALKIDPSTEGAYDPRRPEEMRRAEDVSVRSDLLCDLVELWLAVGEKARAQRALEEARGLVPDNPRVAELTKRVEG